MKLNYEDLEGLYHFLLEHHVQLWQLQLVNAMGNMEGHDELAISPAQVRKVTEFIRNKNRHRKIVVFAADSIGYFDKTEVYDGNCIANLLHGEEQTVYGDQLYAGRSDVIADHAPKAADLTNERVRQRDVENPGHARNREKTRVRARVEHPFHTIKRVFGFGYTRLKGIAKNTNRLYVTCAMANLHRCRHRLAA